LEHYEPDLASSRHTNEIRKRQLGIDIARDLGCTHFLHLDCDEYYNPDEFRRGKTVLQGAQADGSVCRLWSYFRYPHLRVDKPEGYWVPFIHKLKVDTVCGCNRRYPFYVDPTRNVMPVRNVHEFSMNTLMMHHLSWVRRDIRLKFRNSTANLNNVVWLNTLDAHATAAEGTHVPGWDRALLTVPVPAFFGDVYAAIKDEP